jgi:bifunctional DNA-binding transcriptional regulator/antitoxin component of YhaV-PrlF toxin-antitoxin module
MTDYKKYALGQVENFLYDAMSTDATPQEIYDVIKGVVQDNLEVYTKSADQARELLSLLNGHRPVDLSGWEEPSMPPWGHSDLEYGIHYSEKELDEMCTAAEAKDKVKKWILPVEQHPEQDEYLISFPDDLLEAANLKEGDQIEWIDQGDGSCILKKVKDPSWVKGNELAKVKTYQEMIDDGWSMTDDGFWIKENCL